MFWERESEFAGKSSSISICSLIENIGLDFNEDLDLLYDDSVTWKTSQYEGEYIIYGEISKLYAIFR